jgi:imidazolonepropionase-like amidohydrolase
MTRLRLVLISLFLLFAAGAGAQVTAIRAGHLIDPETGAVANNQIILVQAGRFGAIGPNVTIPQGADVVDLSQYYVSPGLVDAHNHLALTYKRDPENNSYYLTSVMDSTAIRAVQAVSNGITMLSAGFTLVRDLGNNGNYADTALRVGIEQGWIPGPTIINSGIIIGGFGGQFTPVPERETLVYPEYLNADTNDEIVKAIRRNILYGAKVIKIMVDAQADGAEGNLASGNGDSALDVFQPERGALPAPGGRDEECLCESREDGVLHGRGLLHPRHDARPGGH